MQIVNASHQQGETHGFHHDSLTRAHPANLASEENKVVIVSQEKSVVDVSDDDRSVTMFSPTQTLQGGTRSSCEEQIIQGQAPTLSESTKNSNNEKTMETPRGRSTTPRTPEKRQKDVVNKLTRPAKVTKPDTAQTRVRTGRPEVPPVPHVHFESPVNLRDVQQQVDHFEMRQLWKYAKETEVLAEELNEELNASEYKNKQLTAEMESLKAGAAEHTRTSQARKKDLAARCQRMQDFLRGLSNDQHALRKEIFGRKNDLREMKAASDEVRTSLRDATDSMMTTAEGYHQRTEAYKERIVELEACLREKGQELRRVEARVSSETGLREIFESEMSSLRLSMDRTTQLFAGYKEEFADKLGTYSSSLRKVAGDNMLADADIILNIERLNETVGSLSEKIVGTGTEQRQCFTELETGLGTLATAVRGFVESESDSDAVGKIAQTTSAIMSSVAELKVGLSKDKSYSELESGLRQELAAATERLKNVQRALQSSESETTKHYDECQQLRAQLEELYRETNHLKQDLERARQEPNDESKLALINLQNAIDQLKSDLLVAKNDLSMSNQEHETNKHGLENVISDVQHQLAVLRQSNHSEENRQTAAIEVRVEDELQKARQQFARACQAEKRAFGEQYRKEIQAARSEANKSRLAAGNAEKKAQNELKSLEKTKTEMIGLNSELERMRTHAAGEAERTKQALRADSDRIRRGVKELLERILLDGQSYNNLADVLKVLVKKKQHADIEPQRVDSRVQEKELQVKQSIKCKLDVLLLDDVKYESLDATIDSLVKMKEHAAGEAQRIQAQITSKENDMNTKLKARIESFLPEEGERQSVEDAFSALSSMIDDLKAKLTGETQSFGNVKLNSLGGESQDAEQSIYPSQRTDVGALEQDLLALDEQSQGLQDVTSAEPAGDGPLRISTPSRPGGPVSLEMLQNTTSPIGDTRGLFPPTTASSRPASNHGARRSGYLRSPEPLQNVADEQSADVRRTLDALRHVPRFTSHSEQAGGIPQASQAARRIPRRSQANDAVFQQKRNLRAGGQQQSSAYQSHKTGYDAEAESQQAETQMTSGATTDRQSSDLSSLHSDIEDDEHIASSSKQALQKPADSRYDADVDSQPRAPMNKPLRPPTKSLKRPSVATNSLPNKTPKTIASNRSRTSVIERERLGPTLASPAPTPGGSSVQSTRRRSSKCHPCVLPILIAQLITLYSHDQVLSSLHGSSDITDREGRLNLPWVR